MKIRSLIAVLFCLLLLFVTLTGCNASETDPLPEPETEVSDDPPVETNIPEITRDPFDDPSGGIDFDAAFLSFAPDTVMIRADDLYVTWADLYVFLFRSVVNLSMYSPNGIDWSEVLDDITMSDMVLEFATDEVLTFTVLEYGANTLNATLAGDNLALFNDELNTLIEMYNGKGNLEEVLRENSGFYNFDVFERFFRIEFTVGEIMFELYGDESALFPDEEVADFAERNDFMMAKHILRLRTADGDDDALNEIEDILELLNKNTDSENIVEVFSTLMHIHSEDSGGMMSFPNGYLFQPFDMVVPFSEACAALEPGQISGIVETEYGYHIILRLPIDYDMVPISAANSGQPHTLRQMAVFENFDARMQEWHESLNLEFTPEYKSINLADIFVWQ